MNPRDCTTRPCDAEFLVSIPQWYFAIEYGTFLASRRSFGFCIRPALVVTRIWRPNSIGKSEVEWKISYVDILHVEFVFLNVIRISPPLYVLIGFVTHLFNS